MQTTLDWCWKEKKIVWLIRFCFVFLQGKIWPILPSVSTHYLTPDAIVQMLLSVSGEQKSSLRQQVLVQRWKLRPNSLTADTNLEEIYYLHAQQHWIDFLLK